MHYQKCLVSWDVQNNHLHWVFREFSGGTAEMSQHWERGLLLKWTQVQFPAPWSECTQPSVPPSPGYPMPLFGFCGNLHAYVHTHIQTYIHTQTNLKKKELSHLLLFMLEKLIESFHYILVNWRAPGFVLCNCNIVSETINLKRGKFYFGSKFHAEVDWAYCLGPMAFQKHRW